MTNTKPIHISELDNPTAKRIVATDLIKDGYHNAIKTDAQAMVRMGWGDKQFLGSDTSTLWSDKIVNLIVLRKGELSI